MTQTPEQRWTAFLKNMVKTLEACGPQECYMGMFNVNTEQYVAAVALCEFKEAWDNKETQETLVGVYGHGLKEVMQDVTMLDQ